MKNLFYYIFKRKWFLVFSLIISFSLGFLLGNIYNYNTSYYECNFKVNDLEHFNINKLTDKDFLNDVKKSAYDPVKKTNKYENININKLLKNKDFIVTHNDDGSFTIKTPYKYYDVFFVNSSQKLSNRAKTFIRDALSMLDSELKVEYTYGTDIVKIQNEVNIITVSLISMLLGELLVISLFTILYYKKIEKNDEFVYDNEQTFSSFFHKSYWKNAVNAISTVKDLTTFSLLLALIILCKFIPLPSGFGDLGISLTYLFLGITGIIYGPIYGFLMGVLSDVTGFFINSTGYFFLGYTLQAALTSMIYGLLFYKTKINFTKVFMCRVIVNLFMNAVLGSFLYTIVFSNFSLFSANFNNFFISYFTLLSLPKNLIYLLPQSLFMFYFFKFVSPLLFRYKLINKNIYNHIKVFN